MQGRPEADGQATAIADAHAAADFAAHRLADPANNLAAYRLAAADRFTDARAADSCADRAANAATDFPGERLAPLGAAANHGPQATAPANHFADRFATTNRAADDHPATAT